MTVEEAAKKMIELSEDPGTCKCARITYRNNPDGSRDVFRHGNMSCTICRGRGKVQCCAHCDGAGMIPGSRICPVCQGKGKVPA